jgi:myo-inositol-1(or 4)-monophosphatase
LNPTDLDNRLRVAEAVVREAGRVAAEHFARRELLRIDRKGAQDLVSEADRACEDLIIAGLARLLPSDGFVAGERGSRDADATTVWVIDPIDGTHNFLTGVPLLVRVGGPGRRGRIRARDHLPSASGRTLRGEKGRRRLFKWSADQGERRDRAHSRPDLRRFQLSPASGGACQAIGAVLAAGCEYLRLGSGALGLAFTAAGRVDAYWERHMNSWDAAAGLILVREAGGWTHDFLAGDGLTAGGEVLAATPGLFEPLERLIAFGPTG